MKNFKLLFLLLVIIFVSTEAAPKGGRGGGGRGGGRSGGGRGYRGGGYYGGSGGGGDGELPDWAIFLICVVSVGFIAFVMYACCIEEDADDVQSEHENEIPN